MAAPPDAVCSRHVSRSQSIQASIATTAIGTQCTSTVLISQSSQTGEEFSGSQEMYLPQWLSG
ncbi:uncharacterized protein LOC144158529 isoform X2 [Haemaphysalis longicornis]